MRRLAVVMVGVAVVVCCVQRSSGQAAVYAPLEVFTNGPGRISPLSAGQMLEVWGTYSMVALPEPGSAFENWEWVDVFIKSTRLTNNAGGIYTNIEKTVTSKNQFFPNPELTFVVRPVFVMVLNDGVSTTSTYGWRARFGPVREPEEPDVYRTISGATAEEFGDRIPNQSRSVPFSATLTFDLTRTPPSLTAVIPNAVLEGGPAFPLIVRSYDGYQLTNGGYRFTGDYLRDKYPTGSQYFFDWEFTTLTNGSVVWNGTTGWAGGHIWYLTVSNLRLLPQAQLSTTRLGGGTLQVSWRTNFSDYVLESVPALPSAGWSIVTNDVTIIRSRNSVRLEPDSAQGFYRLRQR